MSIELEVQLLIKLRKLIIEKQLFLTNIDEEIQKILCYLDLPKYDLQIIEEQIKNKCQHNYVTDYIDIDPEKSMKICYCTICENNKKGVVIKSCDPFNPI